MHFLRRLAVPLLVAVSSIFATQAAGLDPTAHLRGRVLDGNSKPLNGAVFEASVQESLSHSVTVSQTTLSDGTFDIQVWGGNWGFHIANYAQLGLIDRWDYVKVTDGVDQMVTYVTPTPTGSVTGRIATASGVGVSGIGLSVIANVDGTNYATFGRTDINGRFNIGTLTGIWVVSVDCAEVFPLRYDCLSQQGPFVAGFDTPVNFTVQPWYATSTLTGKVVDEAGAPVTGVRMALSALEPFKTFSRTAISDAEGRFKIPVYSEMWELKTEAGVPNGKARISLSVSVNEIDTHVTMNLRANDSTIDGSLLSTNGTPIGGVPIFATGMIENFSYRSSPGLTDADGRFSIPVFKSIGWTVAVDANAMAAKGFYPANSQTVEPNWGSTDLKLSARPIELPPAPTLIAPRLEAVGDARLLRFGINGAPGTYDIYGSREMPFAQRWIGVGSIETGQTNVDVEVDTDGFQFFEVRRAP